MPWQASGSRVWGAVQPGGSCRGGLCRPLARQGPGCLGAYARLDSVANHVAGARCVRARCTSAAQPPAITPTYARLAGDWRRPLVAQSDLDALSATLERAGHAPVRGVAVALGKFDAMHLGHAALAARARAMRALPCLLSFHGMAAVLRLPPRQPLTAECDRERVLRAWARDCGGVAPLQRSVPFADVRELSAPEFVRLLAEELKVVGVVAGSNYRFGYKAQGDAALLRAEGEARGLAVDIVELRDASNAALGTASSTSVRELVRGGAFDDVPAYLGRPYALVVPRSAVRRLPGGGAWDFVATGALNAVPAAGGYAVRAFDRAAEGAGGVEGSLWLEEGACRLVLCEAGFEIGAKGVRLEIVGARDHAAMSALHCGGAFGAGGRA